MYDFCDNSSWSKQEKDYFYYCLHQLTNDMKAHCLNLKAKQLIKTKRKKALLGVVELTKESVEGYPNKSEILRSYLLKAEAEEMLGRVKAADESYSRAMEWLGLISRDKLDAVVDYLTFILRHRLRSRYDEAMKLTEVIEEDVYRLLVHDFVMLAARAILAFRIEKKRRYRTANEALKLVQIRRYRNSDEKTGLVDLEKYDFMISNLLKIVK